MRSGVIAVVAALALSGCGPNLPVLADGPRYSALPVSTRVSFYMRESDIHEPYEVLATVTAMDLGKYQMLTIQDSFPTLAAKARSVGANGVIIDNYQPVKSGIFSTGYSVFGRAVRVANHAGPRPTS